MGTNRLQSLTGATTTTFGYDPIGNTVTEGTRQLVYNENNRLVQVRDGGVLGDYAYNAYGERSVKTVQGATTVFFYDRKTQTLISESDGLAFKEYVYADRIPIAKASETEILFIHTDHLDTPVIMTDSSSTPTVVWRLDNRPFGDGASVTGTTELNLRFPGQYYDEESGLHQNWHRDYYPLSGRYLQADPLSFTTLPDVYTYVKNNPLVFADPSGLYFQTIGGLPPPPGTYCIGVAASGAAGFAGYLARGGGVSFKYCWDSEGNRAFLFCATGFLGVGSGAMAGMEGGWNANPICDLVVGDDPKWGDFGWGATGGGAAGSGVAATATPSSVDAAVGVGIGGYGGGGVAGVCKFFGKPRLPCDVCEPDNED